MRRLGQFIADILFPNTASELIVDVRDSVTEVSPATSDKRVAGQKIRKCRYIEFLFQNNPSFKIFHNSKLQKSYIETHEKSSLFPFFTIHKHLYMFIIYIIFLIFH